MADQPMPPQGGAAPAQAPAPDDAQQGGDQGQSQGGVAEFIIGLDQGLAKLQALMQQSQQVPPEAQKAMQAAVDNFHTAVEALTGKSSGAAPADAGSAPMQAGGNSGAEPAY